MDRGVIEGLNISNQPKPILLFYKEDRTIVNIFIPMSPNI